MTAGRAAARLRAVARAGTREPRHFTRVQGADGEALRTSEYFGTRTFSFDLMEKQLSPADLRVLKEFATSREPLPRPVAERVAKAVREWALSQGATHYCHWFQPQTGATAEKHDAFFAFDGKGGVIEQFGASQLIQAEPDASSFPSGGVRATFEARGYTAWDASSPMFLMEAENGLTLCIPSVFISYSGQALDKKTPLLRSIAVLSQHATDALKLMGHASITHVAATAGPEQEYFLIDEALYNLRPDLQLAGRTLFGRNPPRHQQLEDHYFGSIKPRVLAFMTEAEQELYRLGVPVKTRHNEVAPAQCEMAPIFETANVAADHNQVAMEVLRTVARRHRLVALFHEKPYQGINGSGKHVNWSLADSDGHNLLEPGDAPHENVRFLYFVAATVKAVHDYGALLRMAVATPGNDFRLGANEAPPAIMSVFLGDTLSETMDRIVGLKTGELKERASQINLDLAKVPVIKKDNTDRNRTSPFAFTGNKFEFRAVGASASISMPLVFVNAAVAKSLKDMNERLRKAAGSARPNDEQVLAVIQQVVRETAKIRFEGDNYSADWHKEAERRGLPNLRTTPDALKAMTDDGAIAMLAELGIMSKDETISRYNVRLERFTKVRLIELETFLELLSTHVLPATFAHQARIAKSVDSIKDLGAVHAPQQAELGRIAGLTVQLLKGKERLQALLDKVAKTHDEPKVADLLASDGMQLMTELRQTVNDAELTVDDDLWSLPKYREMLYHL